MDGAKQIGNGTEEMLHRRGAEDAEKRRESAKIRSASAKSAVWLVDGEKQAG
jgi:hypothetical protein